MRTSLLVLHAILAAPLAQAQEIQPRPGDPMPGLSLTQLQRFNLGRQVFVTPISLGEGRGPVFNDDSCIGCHFGPAAGGGSSIFVTRFGKAAAGGMPFDPLDSLGGSLLQANSINSPSCDEQIPAQADVTAMRVTPPLFGFGLIDSILDSDILVNEVFPPTGVSGRAHMVHALEDPIGAPPRVGRFGFKAGVATVLSFSADASMNEMGLTNRLLPVENAPNGNQAQLAMCDTAADPEDVTDAGGMFKIDRMTDFQRLLAPPPQTPRSGMSGAAIFDAVGCNKCHLSTPFTTPPTAEAGLANISFRPYSDFLVHDIGSTADQIVDGTVSETEMRTTPLWGLRNRATLGLWHDMRASGGTAEQNIAAAIQLHEGEGLGARSAFNALSTTQKNQLTQFLLSLGRLEFDYEGNSNVDEVDWFFLRTLVSGPAPASPILPDDVGAVADFDQDGDFDLEDFGALQRAFTGP